MNISPAVRTTAPTQPEQVDQRQMTISPLVDVYENAQEILLFADVPGATKDGIDIRVDNGQVSLSAHRDTTSFADRENLAPIQSEVRAYDYYRVFAVPTGIEPTKIEAELTAGVLKVRFPKSDALKPRQIAVKAG
jgi:HSP20 family molecular chaperone IbpA